MTARKRPKSVRKARALALSRQERAYSASPHSFVFSRPGVGKFVRQLTLDIRGVFEPFTATRLRVHRRNVLKDLITVAGPLHVTHLLYLTHPHREKLAMKRLKYLNKKARHNNHGSDDNSIASGQNEGDTMSNSFQKQSESGVYLHLVRSPHGPSLTFSVVDYSLQRDVLTVVRRIFDSHQFTTPPLLAMTGFGSLGPDSDAKHPSPPPPHLRLIVDMFQNMLPSLNVQKLKLSTIRRVLLISREVDASSDDPGTVDDVIYIRHYNVRTEDRSVSRALRRLRIGGALSKKRALKQGEPEVACGLGPGGSGKSSGVPNLGKYTCMEDFLTKTSLLSDSGLSDALSDLEEVELPEQKVSLPDKKLKGSRRRSTRPYHGLHHLGTARKATVRLTEIGPRLTLRLLKIEEGLNTGAVLYHRWQTRSLSEITLQSERLRQREALRAARRAEHEARRAANEAAREAHRATCLEGMKRAGQLPPPAQSTSVLDPSAMNDDASVKRKSSLKQKDTPIIESKKVTFKRKLSS